MPKQKKTSKKTPKSGDRFGFLDEAGAVAIEPQFLDVRDFAQGGAWVQTDAGWGRIDAAGAWLCEPRFPEIGKAQCGLRRVLLDGQHQWVLERDGSLRADGFMAGTESAAAFDAAGRYWGNHGGYTDPKMRMTRGGTWQLYDAEHAEVGPPLPEGHQPMFVAGDRCVSKDGTTGTWQLRDLDGNTIGPERKHGHLGFSAGRMLFRTEAGYGAFDLAGGVAIEPQLAFLSPFDEQGRAVAWLGGDRVAVVDLHGSVLAEAAPEPLEGRDVVCTGGFEGGYAKVELRAQNPNYHARRANLLRPDGTCVRHLALRRARSRRRSVPGEARAAHHERCRLGWHAELHGRAQLHPALPGAWLRREAAGHRRPRGAVLLRGRATARLRALLARAVRRFGSGARRSARLPRCAAARRLVVAAVRALERARPRRAHRRRQRRRAEAPLSRQEGPGRPVGTPCARNLVSPRESLAWLVRSSLAPAARAACYVP